MTRGTPVTSGIVAIGIAVGATGGYALGRVAALCLEGLQRPDPLTVLGAAAVVSGVTVAASLAPAARGK
jgi:H+/Cl- antiporter ClcA